MKPTALIADDEPLARRKLRDLVEAVPLVDIVGEAADGRAAAAAIDMLQPDIVFLDVEMPGLSGLAVLEQIDHRPAIIFTTAYDRYAVAAFEMAAVDYLLKPFGRERFRTALERALRALGSSAEVSATDRARDTLERSRPLTRLFVRDRGRILPVAVADVVRFEARDNYVAVHVKDRIHLLHIPLQTLAERLDPERFVRVHRSHVINLDHVRSFEAYDGTRLLVELHDGTKVVASRTGTRELKELMG